MNANGVTIFHERQTLPLIVYVEHNAQKGGSVFSLRDLVVGFRNEVHPLVCQFSDAEFAGMFEKMGIDVLTVPFKVFSYKRPNIPFLGSRLNTELMLGRRWLLYTLPLVVAFYVIFRQHRPALVHLNDHVDYHRAEIVASALAGVPCVCHMREIRDRLHPWELWASQFVLRFIAVSKVVAEAAGRAGLPRDRIRTVWNGIDFPSTRLCLDKNTLRKHLRLDSESLYVISHGRLVNWKGIDRLIAIWPAVISGYPNACLLIVGDGPEKRSLQELVVRNGLSNSVRFVGFVENIWDYLLASDVYIHCVTQPEPFGRSIVEAMGANLPVVAPNWGSTAELSDSGRLALLYEPLDYEDLKARLLKLLGDAVLREKLGKEAGLHARQQFTLDRYLNGVREVYAEILPDICRRSPLT